MGGHLAFAICLQLVVLLFSRGKVWLKPLEVAALTVFFPRSATTMSNVTSSQCEHLSTTPSCFYQELALFACLPLCAALCGLVSSESPCPWPCFPSRFWPTTKSSTRRPHVEPQRSLFGTATLDVSRTHSVAISTLFSSGPRFTHQTLNIFSSPLSKAPELRRRLLSLNWCWRTWQNLS
jgi:hypothetical protein